LTEEKNCLVGLALHDAGLTRRYAVVLSAAGYEVRVLSLPIDMRELGDIDIVVLEVRPEHVEEVAARLRTRRRLFRGVIVGISDATVPPARRRIAVQAGFNELLCGPCGPQALLELIERLRTIRPDDIPCEPESEKPAQS
jgi:hypothetical protein